jgi:hypothetical protein
MAVKSCSSINPANPNSDNFGQMVRKGKNHGGGKKRNPVHP